MPRGTILPPKPEKETTLMQGIGAPKPANIARAKKYAENADLPVPTVPEEMGRTIPVSASKRPDARRRASEVPAKDRDEIREAGWNAAGAYARINSLKPDALEQEEEKVRPLISAAVEECLLRDPNMANGSTEEIVDRLIAGGIVTGINKSRLDTTAYLHRYAEDPKDEAEIQATSSMVRTFYSDVFRLVSKALETGKF